MLDLFLFIIYLVIFPETGSHVVQAGLKLTTEEAKDDPGL